MAGIEVMAVGSRTALTCRDTNPTPITIGKMLLSLRSRNACIRNVIAFVLALIVLIVNHALLWHTEHRGADSQVDATHALCQVQNRYTLCRRSERFPALSPSITRISSQRRTMCLAPCQRFHRCSRRRHRRSSSTTHRCSRRRRR